MTNYKKTYDLFIKSTKEPTELIKQLSVVDAVKNCDLLTDYETLIKRSIKDNELNLICDFVYNFESNLSYNLIAYNLFRLLTENEDWDEATSTRNAMFRVNDLKDSDKSSQIYDLIIDIIRDYSDDIDYLI